MKIYVDLDHVDITEYTQIESGEYNTQKINFIFTPEYKDLVKVAIFGSKLDTEEPKFYKVYLSDDTCYLPSEVTATSDVISIGVYAFNVEGGALKLRYSPTPVKTIVYEGSFREEAENSSSPTPTEIEQIMSRIISLESLTQELDTRVGALENKACDLDTLKSDVSKLKEDVVDLDNRLDTVEGDLANTYSKTEVDTLLAAKVDTTTYTTGQAAQDEKLLKLIQIASQLPTVSGEGTNISLSPTIEYDLEVDSLKGDTKQNTLTGKNLLNPSNNKNNWGIASADGRILATYPRYAQYCEVTQNQVYSVSRQSKGTSSYYWYGFYENQPDIGSVAITFGNIEDNTLSAVITAPANAHYLVVFYGTGESVNTMIEKGNQTTSYEPYCGGIPSPNPNYPQDIQVVTGTQEVTISNSDNTESQTYTLHLGDLELAKIGNYQDKIYYDNGKWYLEKQIGKVVLNGSETSWAYASGNKVFWSSLNGLGFDYPSSYKGYVPKISNYFTYYASSGNNPDLVDGMYENTQTSSNSQVLIHFASITNVDDFKTWLSTHNTIVNYVLNTASTTEITNENLLSNLEYIRTHAKSYSGTTNISSSGNLPIIIAASALKQLS